jgi:release factor glutamine methyltransferase
VPTPTPAPTLLETMLTGARALEAAGLPHEDSLRDATVLARRLLNWDAARWLTRREGPASPEFRTRFEAWIARRARREPVAYLVGSREFYGRDFAVTPDVLIPRPETELIVASAIERAQAYGDRPQIDILDAGTGSGCLAVTLALELPAARIVATDITSEALRVAAQNAAVWGVADRVAFRQAPLTGGATAAFDLVVSNPPYVEERERETLAPDVRDYEPAVALFGGSDGLDVIRQLLPEAARALRPKGWLVMEIGHGHAAAVGDLLDRGGWTDAVVRTDLSGIARVAIARRPETSGVFLRHT